MSLGTGSGRGGAAFFGTGGTLTMSLGTGGRGKAATSFATGAWGTADFGVAVLAKACGNENVGMGGGGRTPPPPMGGGTPLARAGGPPWDLDLGRKHNLAGALLDRAIMPTDDMHQQAA